MKVIDAETTHRLGDYPGLIEGLRGLFARGCDVVDRMGLAQPNAPAGQRDWLLLPAWQYDRHFGAKLVSVFPGNEEKHGVPSILGLYLLFDGQTGTPLACIDGAALTLRKTAANSALAATYLARKDARRLLMVGAGALAPHLAMAHCAVREYEQVLVWNRTLAKAEQVAAELASAGYPAQATEDLEAGVREADVVSCATMATVPLVRGAWLRPGIHLDLVGGFREDMREADDEAVRRARIFVDARFTAAAHAGDIYQPLASGLIKDQDITDTFELARGDKPGRQSDEEITLFKSGGGGHEDLGTAQYLMEKLGASSPS